MNSKTRFASFAELSMDNIVDSVMDGMNMEMTMDPSLSDLEDIYDQPTFQTDISQQPSLEAYDQSNHSNDSTSTVDSTINLCEEEEEDKATPENVNGINSNETNLSTNVIKIIPCKPVVSETKMIKVIPQAVETKMEIFEPANQSKLQLKDHIFISKDVTYRLSQYLVKEAWGNQCSLLYKYLDYIFRCQVFNKDIVTISATNKQTGQMIKKYQFLLFHCGLQRRSDNQFLYALLVLNGKNKQQKYRVAFGNIKNSFMSKQDLLDKLSAANMSIDEDMLPKRTKFHQNVSDLLYDDRCILQANWEERIITNQDRIQMVMGASAFFDERGKLLRLTELVNAFDSALERTQRMAEMNPRLTVPQGFVDTKRGTYRMELLLPIIIKFPRFGGHNYKFVLAVGKQEQEKKYVVKSILTMEMAYHNARLCGYVDSFWLCQFGNAQQQQQNQDARCVDINQFCVYN